MYVALHQVTWSMVVWCCAETAAVSCGASHASAVSTDTTSVDIQKTRFRASHSCRTTCERSESAQESGE